MNFSNNGSYRGAYIFNQKPGNSYAVELEYVETSGSFTFGWAFVSDSYDGERASDANAPIRGYYGKVNNDYWGSLLPVGKYSRPTTGDKYRLEVYSNHVDTYLNDNLLISITPTINPLIEGRFAIIGTDTPRNQSWRNIKIKLI